VKSIIENVPAHSITVVSNYLLGLCKKYPIIIPNLSELFKKEDPSEYKNYKDKINSILLEHTLNRRSDAITWCLYFLIKLKLTIDPNIALQVIGTKDCIPILMLYLSLSFEKEVIAFCNNLITNSQKINDCFLLDQYWLLLYQLFYDNKINNPYLKTDSSYTAFEELKKNRVTFITP
jgi:hypothetical protein